MSKPKRPKKRARSKRAQPTEMAAAMVPLDELRALPGNAKLHDREGISASMGRWGFLQRIVVNRSTGHVLAGHGRIEQLRRMRDEEKVRPPANVGRDWTVPVDYVTVPKTQEREVAVALNRLVERGGWDDDALREILKPHATDEALRLAIGFDDFAFRQLIDMPKELNLGEAPKSVKQNAAELKAIRDQRRAGQEAVSERADTERYLMIVFPSREDREALLTSLGLPTDERYLPARSIELRLRSTARPVEDGERKLKTAPRNKAGATG